MLQASPFRLTRPQLKQAGRFTGAARPQRGETPKLKVFRPSINILGLKNLNLLVIVLSVAIKATGQQTVGKRVNCSLCLCLQAKTALKMKNQFPNKETDFAKECLWLLI